MTIKVTIQLDDEKSLGFGTIISHCGKVQPINYHAISVGEWWECVDCGLPILLVTEKGWFEVGRQLKY